jgi:curved DNA-binding protein CbpA
LRKRSVAASIATNRQTTVARGQHFGRSVALHGRRLHLAHEDLPPVTWYYIFIESSIIFMETGSRRGTEGNEANALPLPLRGGTHYEKLGIAPNAAPKDIRSAKNQLLMQYHPDKFEGAAQEQKELAEKVTKEINRVAAALLDDASRAEYDRSLASQSVSSAHGRSRTGSENAGGGSGSPREYYGRTHADYRKLAEFDSWFRSWHGEMIGEYTRLLNANKKREADNLSVEILQQLQRKLRELSNAIYDDVHFEYERMVRQELMLAEFRATPARNQETSRPSDARAAETKSPFDAWFDPWLQSMSKQFNAAAARGEETGSLQFEIERNLKAKTENPDNKLSANQQAEYLRKLRQELMSAAARVRAEQWDGRLKEERERRESGASDEAEWMGEWMRSRDDAIKNDIAEGYGTGAIQAGLIAAMRAEYQKRPNPYYIERPAFDESAAQKMIADRVREHWKAYCRESPWWKRMMKGDFRT